MFFIQYLAYINPCCNEKSSFQYFISLSMTVFDIYGVKENGVLKFKLPFYNFDWNEEIAVSRLVIEWKSPKEKMFGIVETDLVDLSSYNGKQQIFSFSKSERTAVTDILVDYPVFYEVQIKQLEIATLEIKPMFDEPLAEIKNVYLQFITK